MAEWKTKVPNRKVCSLKCQMCEEREEEEAPGRSMQRRRQEKSSLTPIRKINAGAHSSSVKVEPPSDEKTEKQKGM